MNNIENSVLSKTVVPLIQGPRNPIQSSVIETLKNNMNDAITNVIPDCGDSQNMPTYDLSNTIFIKVDRKRRKDKVQSKNWLLVKTN